MRSRSPTERRAPWVTRLIGFAVLAVTGSAFAAGVAQIFTAKSIPQATVEVIDPESGTSSGGGTTDVNVGPGDIILFRLDYFPVPDKLVRGQQGYVTDYIPANTQVVGVRIVDESGLTVEPRLPGLTFDSCGRPCRPYNSVPSASGPRDLDAGSVAALYADTGVFYTTDDRLSRNPSTQFLAINNGTAMSPQPTWISDIKLILGLGANDPVYYHNAWDWTQVRAFGNSEQFSTNAGFGQTPFRYGSPVAGPQTYYGYEATQVGPTTVQFNDTFGPWNRVRYPGSRIGAGSAATAELGTLRRVGSDTSLGVDLTPMSPLPATTEAVRVALGEVRIGEPRYVELALRVNNTPLDPVQMKDVNCAEVHGGDTANNGFIFDTTKQRGRDNPWTQYVASPRCVFLNLKFDLTVDRALAVTNNILTYTLSGKNLSINPQTNVVLKQKYNADRAMFMGASQAPMVVADCDGDGLQCLIWPAMNLAPGAQYSITSTFEALGGGHTTIPQLGVYRSDQLPGGFVTGALSMVKGVPLVKATLQSTTSSVTPGNVGAYSGTISNPGTLSTLLETLTIVLPTGWSVNGSVMLGAQTLICASGCGGSSPTYDIDTSLAAGASSNLSFLANVPLGTASGLYPVDLQVWANGGLTYEGWFETYFRKAALTVVGAPRTAKPVVTCPIASAQTAITGTSEPNAAISLRFNLLQRGTGTADGTGAWSIASSNYLANFGELYGGLEVRAVATAPGKLESELSDPCFVSSRPQCSDGVDNDGDGLTDFPSDPGCENPGDRTENTPTAQCNDGLDNDADLQTDWPFDVGCQGPTDNTENSGAACGDGLDNDGDAATDFPADPDCTSAADGSETYYSACQDGLDNDGDSLRDFPNDPGCHSAFDDTETDVNATPVVKPRLLLLFDSSGSMNWNTCNDTFTGGDGTSECPGSNVPCATCVSSTCGNTFADDSRLFKVKAGITSAVSAFGEVEYGLMRFRQRAVDFVCPSSNAGLRSGAWQGGGAAPCGYVSPASPGFNAGDLLVSFARDNEQTLLDWINGDSDYPGNPQAYTDQEIRGSGTTPLGGILTSANAYLDQVRAGDTQIACRPYRVILITDGAETCGGNPVQAATDLRNDGALVYVVGFATPNQAVINNLNAIAAAGGGRPTAIFVDDEAELSAAIAQIIQDSVIQERCNGVDDDCDMFIDEDFPDLGLPPNPPPPQTCTNGQFGVCARAGVRVCAADQLGTTCSAPTVTPGVESCNGLDDDCDRSIDENLGGCMTCTAEQRAQPEICNNLDDNCNGMIDEAPIPGVGTSCGLDIGECNPGTLQCTGGSLVCTGGQGPVNETCNSLDDDCDTFVDEISVECYTFPSGCTANGSGGFTCAGTCRSGTQTCSGNMLGACSGQIGPATELCNGSDDDCDTRTDEAFPTLGMACDNGQPGVCRQTGTLVCNANGTGVSCTAPTVTPGIEVCNSLDDDCDGQTDEMLGPPIGTACGGSGSCSAGTFQCVNGAVTCVGSMGGMPETCNGVDDDCDNSIDELPLPGVGGNCVAPGFGTFDMQGNCTGACDVGRCEFGDLICAGGVIVCDGYVGPRPEICNGLDDDCDGNADDMATCPVNGQACLQGECANPCAAGEFPCPFGFYCQMGPVPGPSDDFCVRDPCATVTCQPGFACNQMTGQCDDLCNGVTCPTGLSCFGGICQDCFSLGCDPGELCVREGTGPGMCVPDPCFNVMCNANQACVDGTCVTVTCDPPCAASQRCEDGMCVGDPCNGVNCGPLEVCDPRSGECVDDLCRDVVCGNGQDCHPGTGECIADPCTTINCPPGLECTVDFDGNGQCGVPAEPPRETITAAGGGGCAAGGGERSAVVALLILLLGIGIRPSRRAARTKKR